MTRPSEIWLSEITLKQRAKGINFDSGIIHRWLTKAADGPSFLWVSPRPGLIIVQSAEPLQAAALKGSAAQVFAAPHSIAFEPGQRVEISGIVAPTKAVPRAGQRGKIVSLTAEETPSWITRKTSGACRLEQITAQQMSPSKGKKLDGTPLLHPRVSVHAYADVKDPEAFTDLLASGLGRGKRFGAGLLLAKAVA